MRNHLSLYIFHVKNTDQNNYPLLQAFRVLIQKICRPTNVFQQAPDISISDYIPQNLPTDLNSSIHVTSDFFLLERGWRGGDFLMAEASRAYPA